MSRTTVNTIRLEPDPHPELAGKGAWRCECSPERWLYLTDAWCHRCRARRPADAQPRGGGMWVTRYPNMMSKRESAEPDEWEPPLWSKRWQLEHTLPNTTGYTRVDMGSLVLLGSKLDRAPVSWKSERQLDAFDVEWQAVLLDVHFPDRHATFCARVYMTWTSVEFLVHARKLLGDYVKERMTEAIGTNEDAAKRAAKLGAKMSEHCDMTGVKTMTQEEALASWVVAAENGLSEELARAIEQLESAANDWASAVWRCQQRMRIDPTRTDSPESLLLLAIRRVKLARGKQ